MALPVATLNLNTSFHKSLGYCPYEMMFGRNTMRNRNVLLEDSFTPTDLYAQVLKKQLEDVHTDAITAQIRNIDWSRPHFDARHRPRNFEVGDLVFVRIGGRKPKLAHQCSGPFKVTNRKNDIYKLESQDRRTQITRHTSSLKPYHGDPLRSTAPLRPVTYQGAR